MTANKRKLLGCAWLGALCCLTSPMLGDGVIRDGLGAISAGRGSTNIAHADNGAIIADNPAGIANVPGTGLAEVSFDVLFTDIHYSDPQNDVDSADNPVPLAHAALIKKSADGRWAWSLGFFAPAGFGAEYDMEGPAQLPGQRHYESFGAMAKILPGAAYRLSDRLSVGGTLGMAISHIELEAPYFLQSPGPFQGLPTILDLQTTGTALTWSAGLQYQWTGRTTVGLVYQDQTRFRLDGNARVEVPPITPLPSGGQSYFDVDLRKKWPRSVGLGVKHTLCPHRRLSLDVIWFGWSDAFDHFDLTFSDPQDSSIAALVGPTLLERFPLNWRDTVSVRAGYEYALDDCRTLRFGYIYHRNPIPDETLTTYIQATLEHGFSAGYGWKTHGYDVNLAYQFSFGSERNIGTSDIIGGDFSNGRSLTLAHWLFLGFLKNF